MAVTRTDKKKRPASSAETGSPDSPSSGKRRKVTKSKTKAKAKKLAPTPTYRRGAKSLGSGVSAASATSSPSSLKKRIASSPARKSTASRFALSRSTHGMRTRGKARIFRFFDLPAEVRNLVYASAYRSDSPAILSQLRMPQSIKVPKILSEALPFWFENTPITIHVLGNWCVRFQHLHRLGQLNYSNAGKVTLPRILEEGGVRSRQVRFKQLHYRVKCACCAEGKVILNVDVGAKHIGNPSKVLVETEVVNRQSVYAKVVDGLDKMCGVAKKAAEDLVGREDFNGFTVEDVQALALSFRDDDCDGVSRDHGDDN